MNQPIVSVVMPVFNSAVYVRESIQSVLNQNFQDFELIIIDDGSTDDTSKIINTFIDKRIKIFTFAENCGIVEALNYGLKHSRGEYVARMDSDDLADDFWLEKQINYLQSDRCCVLIGASYRIIDSDKFIIMPQDDAKIRFGLLFRNVIAHPGSVFRRDVIIQNNLFYRKEYFPAEDYDFWVRLSAYGKIKNTKEILFNYRVHSNSITHTGNPNKALILKQITSAQFQSHFSFIELNKLVQSNFKYSVNINFLFYELQNLNVDSFVNLRNNSVELEKFKKALFLKALTIIGIKKSSINILMSVGFRGFWFFLKTLRNGGDIMDYFPKITTK